MPHHQELPGNSPETKDLAPKSSQPAHSKRSGRGEGEGEGGYVRIPLCQRIKDNGVRCGSPALRGKSLCYFHARPRRRPKPVLPDVPDPADHRAVLQWTIRGLMRGTLDPRAAGQIIYTVQQLMHPAVPLPSLPLELPDPFHV